MPLRLWYNIKTMQKVIDFFKGKKTYIVGLLMIALGIATADQSLVLEGFGLMTLRAGVSKIGQ